MHLQWRPGFALAPYVEMLWCYEGYEATHRQERVLPNARFQLIIDLAPRPGPSIIVGMRTRYSILETANVQSVIGVVFRPGGARPFFDAPADEFFNRPVALDQVWGWRRGRARCARSGPPGRVGPPRAWRATLVGISSRFTASPWPPESEMAFITGPI